VRILSDADAAGAQGSTSTENIRRLSQGIVRGSEAAFERFYELYSSRLYRWLLVLTRGSEDAAREVQQAVMIKAARKFRIFDTEAELWAWLSQVARNTYVDLIRKQARYSTSSDFKFEPSTPGGSESSASSETAAEGQLLGFLDAGLSSLAPDDRQLIESIYFQERAQKEVAQAGGTTVKAVESKLARLRAKLRQFIVERMQHEDE
jgi:RNA polymerase sigma factor (sigma-70 family)